MNSVKRRVPNSIGSKSSLLADDKFSSVGRIFGYTINYLHV